jgi:biopolymer transport protein ExbD
MAGTQNIGEATDNPVAINVTAMVDVIFCLCIFFMCSFHFKQVEGKIDAWLPKEIGNQLLEVNKPIIVEEVRVFLRWDPAAHVTLRSVGSRHAAANDADLMGVIRADVNSYRQAHKTPPLVIQAMEDVPWEDVLHVMDLCKLDGIEPIRLVEPDEYLRLRRAARKP